MEEKTIRLAVHEPSQRLLAALPEPSPLGKNPTDRALFDQTSECVFIIGLDLRYLAVNPQALNLLGYEEAELIGRPVSKIISLDDELTHASILGDGPSLYERILKRKDGSVLPVEISTSIIYNTGNEPAYIQSIARDISEQKNAEKTFQRQTHILSVISDATARLLQSSNIESGIPDVLELMGRLMGVFCCAIVDINTFSGLPSVDVLYQWMPRERKDFDLPGLLTLHASNILSAGGQSYEAQEEKFSFGAIPAHGVVGSWKFLVLFEEQDKLSWTASERDAIQTAATLIGSALQRNSYEEALRLSETRNRIILFALPDLLIRVNVDGTILDYSANPNQPLYLQRDMVTDRKLSEIWPEEVVRRILGEGCTAGLDAPHVVEQFMLPYSNSEYEARLHPIDAHEILIVVRDVTEQLQLDQMKPDFINRVSHELRTPVTSAILMTELIHEGGPKEELDEYWRTLRSELNRQKILIDRLLIAGRLESGMLVLDRVPLDLTPIIAESMQAVVPIAYKRKVNLQFNRPERKVFIIGDKSGLEQAFINLINNATKFSPEGKTVTVQVVEHETTVDIIIADQGLGIPAEAIPHLFERFYRAQNVTLAEIPGSGIGLYIVNSIVEELGGHITVYSVLNQGATFTVTLNKSNS
jgi:PAS domain S-box-containing protein